MIDLVSLVALGVVALAWLLRRPQRRPERLPTSTGPLGIEGPWRRR